jgi:hypothetical protein
MMQPRPLTSLPTDVVSTGDPQLDYVLRGGLPCGSLTEVVGECAGSSTKQRDLIQLWPPDASCRFGLQARPAHQRRSSACSYC